MKTLEIIEKQIGNLKLKYILRLSERNIYSIILIENNIKKINLNISDKKDFAYSTFTKISNGLVTSTCFYEIIDELIE